jgi:hypothetical protein
MGVIDMTAGIGGFGLRKVPVPVVHIGYIGHIGVPEVRAAINLGLCSEFEASGPRTSRRRH